MRSIVLVFPEVMPESPQSGQWTLLPLPLLSIAAPLVDAGYDVTVLDQRVEPEWESRLSVLLRERDVVCVGISAMSGYPIGGGLAASQAARRAAPDIPVVWGGVHPSLLPRQTLESPLVDYVVTGEGETAFAGLVEALIAGRAPETVPGVFTLRDGEFAGTPPECFLDLESLPRPAYELVDVSRYLNAPLGSGGRPLALQTSRGCPSRCRYCYNLAFNRSRWRCMSAARVREDAEYLIGTYGVDAFFLLDDNFFANERRVREICDWVLSERPGVSFLNANCRVDTALRYSDETLEMLSSAGFDRLFVGVESGSDRILAAVEKGITVAQVLEVNRRLRDAGIVPVYSFMVGFPGETRADVQATLDLMVALVDGHPRARVNPLNLYSPFPGTPLYDEAVASGMSEPASLGEWVALDYVRVNYSAGFSPEDLAFMRKAYLLSNLIDPKLARGREGVRGTLRRAYSGLVRSRVKRGFYGWMPELEWLERRWEAAAGEAA